MKYFLGLFLLMLAVCKMGSLAFADVTTVDIAKDHLLIEQQKREEKKNDWVEINFSSWIPGHFTLPSQVGSEVTFGRAAFPGGNVNYSLQATDDHSFNYQLGFGLLVMNRSAYLVSGGEVSQVSQTLDLFSIRMGGEYMPKFMKNKNLETYFDFSLLPTTAVTGYSAFDGGSTYFGVPLEFRQGVRIQAKAFGLDFDRADLDLGIVETVGSIHASSLGGVGVNAGLRIML